MTAKKPAGRNAAARAAAATGEIPTPLTRKPPGKASKLTPALQRDLCDLLRRGHYIHSACAYVGIHRDTYRAWRDKGSDGQALRAEGRRVPVALSPFLRFLEETDTARDYGEAWLVEMTLRAASDPKLRDRWQAYMTILERSRPERWARKPRVDPAAKDDGKPSAPPMIDTTRLSEEELDQLLALVDKAQPQSEQPERA